MLPQQIIVMTVFAYTFHKHDVSCQKLERLFLRLMTT